MLALAVVLAAGLGAVLGAKPAWRSIHRHRAHEIAARGEVLADQGRWKEVGPLVNTALGLAPADLRCARLAARYFTAARSPNAMHYWQLVINAGEATYAERCLYGKVAVALGRPDLANPMLAQLHAERPEDPLPYRLELELARSLKNDSLRSAISSRWLDRNPADPEPQFQLGSALALSQSPRERGEGQRLLWGLVVSSNLFSLPALSALADSPGLSEMESGLLLRRLEKFPLANQLAVADLRLRLRPAEKSNIVAKVVERVGIDTNPVELLAAARWLADHEAVAELIPLLAPERIVGSPLLRAARWEALIEGGRTEELHDFVEAPPPEIPPFLLHCLRASAAHAKGQAQSTVAHCGQAVQAAGKDPRAHQFIAKLAERLDQPKIALARRSALVLEFGAGLRGALEVLRLARLVDDLAAAGPVLSRLRDLMPSEDGVALTAAYLDALFGTPKPEVLARIRELVPARAREYSDFATLALCEWKSGDPSAALKVIETEGLDWTHADPRSQAVYVGVLGASGQREAASRQARRIPLEPLCREERALLEARK